MILIGYPGAQVLEDRPDGATLDMDAYRAQWPSCTAVPFAGSYADLLRYGPAPTQHDLEMAGGHDARPYAMPAMSGAVLLSAVNTECARRIYAQVSAEAQMNILAYSADLAAQAATGATLSDAQKADLVSARAVRTWISGATGMQATCRALIAAGDAGFASDAKWPAWSADWTAFVARF